MPMTLAHNEAIDYYAVSDWDRTVLGAVFDAAFRFDSLDEFRTEDNAKYRVAKFRGVLDYIASKMPSGTKTEKDCYLYYVCFHVYDPVSEKDTKLFKIGITIHSDIETRFKHDLLDGTKMEVLRRTRFHSIDDAYQVEQNILKENAEHRYYGPKFLRTTNTSEVFSSDIRFTHNDRKME